MKKLLFFFALCVLGTKAIPKPIIRNQQIQSRVANGVRPDNAPHAFMVLVRRPTLAPGIVVLGGGSIISSRHAVTAAHLVQRTGNSYQIGFLVGTNRRILDLSFALIHQDFNATTYDSDVALLFLSGTASFPIASIIAIATELSVPAAGNACTLVGFGFTSATATGASNDPYAAAQGITNSCIFDEFEAAATHVCGLDEGGSSVVCPGDNGAGLFLPGTDTTPNSLVGIASRILIGCATPQYTAYTRVSIFAVWIQQITGAPADTFVNMNISVDRFFYFSKIFNSLSKYRIYVENR